MFYKTSYQSPFGKIVMIADGYRLYYLNFVGQKHFLNKFCSDFKGDNNLKLFIRTKKFLDSSFDGKRVIFDVDLSPQGTYFQQSIWTHLLKIPYSKTTTYGQIANSYTNTKMSARAVGQAVSCNPILIIIPCHRVVCSNGSVGGYAAGIEIKKKLLELELSNSTTKSVISF